MISHTDDRFMEIILKIGAEDIFKTARYVMQLEDLKQHANVMVDNDKTYSMPKSVVTYRKPRRISEEQRDAKRVRMNPMLLIVNL